MTTGNLLFPNHRISNYTSRSLLRVLPCIWAFIKSSSKAKISWNTWLTMGKSSTNLTFHSRSASPRYFSASSSSSSIWQSSSLSPTYFLLWGHILLLPFLSSCLIFTTLRRLVQTPHASSTRSWKEIAPLRSQTSLPLSHSQRGRWSTRSKDCCTKVWELFTRLSSSTLCHSCT